MQAAGDMRASAQQPVRNELQDESAFSCRRASEDMGHTDQIVRRRTGRSFDIMFTPDGGVRQDARLRTPKCTAPIAGVLSRGVDSGGRTGGGLLKRGGQAYASASTLPEVLAIQTGTARPFEVRASRRLPSGRSQGGVDAGTIDRRHRECPHWSREAGGGGRLVTCCPASGVALLSWVWDTEQFGVPVLGCQRCCGIHPIEHRSRYEFARTMSDLVRPAGWWREIRLWWGWE